MSDHKYARMQEDKKCTFSPETGTAAHVLAALDVYSDCMSEWKDE